MGDQEAPIIDGKTDNQMSHLVLSVDEIKKYVMESWITATTG